MSYLITKILYNFETHEQLFLFQVEDTDMFPMEHYY